MGIRLSREQAKAMGIAAPKKRHKYGAVATVVDGVKFASKREAKRYSELKLMHLAGTIRNLRLQVKYPIEVRGKLICHYVADFVYWEDLPGNVIRVTIEDVKGMRTPEYKLKKKLMLACHGIDVKEV